MRNKRILVTAEGLEKTKADLKARLEKKEEIKNVIESSRAAGDLKENDGYALAVEDFKNNEVEISRLNEILSNAKVIRAKVKGKVEIGDTVVVKDSSNTERTLSLVGENESNPLNGKISYNSPLGAALLGKKEGEKFEFRTPKAIIKYTLVKVLD